MAAPGAPVQFANILGAQGAPGPQAPPAPWKQWGDHISYLKGTVVGEPTGDNMGDGSLNAEALYINGQPLRFIDQDEYVAKAGDTMTGPLVLSEHPTPASDPLQAATRQYVDDEVLTVGVPDITPAPPANPVPGQLWFDPESLQLYIWYDDGDSAQWVVTINQAPYVPVIPPLDYLPLAGGTLTGPVVGTVAHFDAVIGDNLIADCGPAAVDAALWGSNQGAMRWRVSMVYPQSETGGEVGSNFTIDSYTDAGGYVATPFSINRKTGRTEVSAFTMKGSGGVTIDGAATSYKHVILAEDGSLRWVFGSTDAASGSEFFVNAYDDAGGLAHTPLIIDRDTGHITLLLASVAAAPVDPADVARKAEIDELRNILLGDLEISAVPIGGVIIWPTDQIPPNYLICNGGHYYPADAPLLFAKLQGLYFWDGVTFGVPTMADRAVIGAGTWSLGAMGGEASHALTPAEMPTHAHSLYDPTHAHSLYDPAHNHGWNDPGHAHGLADPGHAHYYTHAANYSLYGGQYPSTGPIAEWGANTNASGTGQGVYAAGCGAWNSASGTGMGVYGAGTGQSVYNAGGGGTHNNMPPFIAQYYIIRYR